MIAPDEFPPLTVDADGTVHVPEVEVPLSSYMSEEAKKRFIERAQSGKERLTAKDWFDPAAVLKVRQWMDNHWYRPSVERAKALYPVNIEERTIGGVRTHIVTSKDGIAARNDGRVLINLHGGGMLSGSVWGGMAESIPIANVGKIRVIAIDYRLAPEHKFPSASEDVASVYVELLKQYKPENIGIYGHSAGGALTAMSIAWLQKEMLPRPGAIGIFGVGIIGTKPVGGDSHYVSGVLDVSFGLPALPPPVYTPTRLPSMGSDADILAALVAPACSDAVLAKFPPTLLISGTRDALLSSTVYAHAQLVRLGVDADLHVWDGMGHSFIIEMDLPESKEAYSVIAKFFESRLGQ